MNNRISLNIVLDNPQKVLLFKLYQNWWSSIISSPEIKSVFPVKDRKEFNRKKNEIIHCAVEKIFSSYDFNKLTELNNENELYSSLIAAFKECISIHILPYPL